MTGRHPTALVPRWMALPLEGLMLLLALLSLISRSPFTVTVGLAAWLIMGVIYVATAWWRLARAGNDADANDIDEDEVKDASHTWFGPTWVDSLIMILVCFTGVGVAVPVITGLMGDSGSPVEKALAIATIFIGWMFLQFGFTKLYSDSYYTHGDGEGMDFPKTEEPGLMEFFYFTFSVGATFQTSDTDVTTAHMRWLVTVHAVVNWLFNTVVIALAVQVLSSAGGQ